MENKKIFLIFYILCAVDRARQSVRQSLRRKVRTGSSVKSKHEGAHSPPLPPIPCSDSAEISTETKEEPPNDNTCSAFEEHSKKPESNVMGQYKDADSLLNDRVDQSANDGHYEPFTPQTRTHNVPSNFDQNFLPG